MSLILKLLNLFKWNYDNEPLLKYNTNGYIDLYYEPNMVDNKEYVLKAVLQDKGYNSNLYYASNRLQNDKDICFAALKQGYFQGQFIGLEILNDKDFVLEAIKIEPSIIIRVNERLQNNKEVAIQVIRQDITLINYLGVNLMDDKDIIREFLMLYNPIKHGSHIHYINYKKYNTDMYYMKELLSINPKLYKYLLFDKEQFKSFCKLSKLKNKLLTEIKTNKPTKKLKI